MARQGNLNYETLMNLAIGQILKKLRKNQHLKQQDVADYLFISRPTYIRYERDEVEPPLSTLFELASLYQFEITDLVKLIDEIIPRDDLNRIILDPPEKTVLGKSHVKGIAGA